jgi:hypothetical protein
MPGFRAPQAPEHSPRGQVASYLEKAMENKPNPNDASRQRKDDGLLEKLARLIDPSGREISDAELIDPGSNIHDTEPAPAKPQPAQPASTTQKPPPAK